MIKFFSKNRKIITIAIIIIAIFLFNINFVLAAADFIDYATNYPLGAVGWAVSAVLSLIAYILTAVIGLLITVVVYLLVQVAQYGNIINVPTVIQGWVIIRDLCNMLFILILLVIAFATILRVESYNYKKLLPKLLIMAILINFSRTIFGLLVDFSQVIMLTFVNSFKEGGGWFINVFRTNMLLTISNKTPGGGDFAVTSWSTSLAVIAGVIAAIITLIVVSIMLAILVIRIIMLWIYTIFSPLIFLGFAIPAIQKYTGKIWEDFIKQLVVGPMLAFFLWLALTTASDSSSLLSSQQLTSGEAVCVGAGAFFCAGNFQDFIIVIGLLVGGLMMAQQTGGAVGSVAGKGMDWARKSAKFVGKKTYDNYGVDKLQQKTGVDLNLPRVWKVLQERRADKKKERYAEGQIAASRAMTEGGRVHGILAMTGSPGDAWDEITHTEGIVPRGVMQRIWSGKTLKKWAGDMEPNLLQTEFESKFVGENEIERKTEEKKLTSKAKGIDKEITKEKSKGINKDNSKIEDLEKQKGIIDKQLAFAAANLTQTFSGAEQTNLQNKAEVMRKQYNKYQTRTPFEARAAEQGVVAAKMSKIKDISAPSELLRMLQDAIKQHDKTMVKAITLKMTKDYNDNEFLGPLAGDTSHLGLKKLMREFADKGSKNYAGFNQQEAFALGSQIAELNKATNHWAATSAYAMENGRWRETTDAEHAMIRSAETGKMHIQAVVRTVNRLGFGKHIGEGYELDEAGLMTLKQLDSLGGIKQLKDNMTESTVQYLYANIDVLRKTGLFSDQEHPDDPDGRVGGLLKAIEERAATVSSDDFYKKFDDYSDKLKAARI